MHKSEKQNLHDTAALRALAEGEVLDANIAPQDEELNLIQPASEDAESVSNKEQTAKFNNNQVKSAGMQFRKTTIPLLYLLGIILWSIGGVTIGKVTGAEPGQYEGNPLLENGILFSIVSIIMGCLLIAGGIFFHYEVRKAEKLNANQ